jgi:hypothetical protein
MAAFPGGSSGGRRARSDHLLSRRVRAGRCTVPLAVAHGLDIVQSATPCSHSAFECVWLAKEREFVAGVALHSGLAIYELGTACTPCPYAHVGYEAVEGAPGIASAGVQSDTAEFTYARSIDCGPGGCPVAIGGTEGPPMPQPDGSVQTVADRRFSQRQSGPPNCPFTALSRAVFVPLGRRIRSYGVDGYVRCGHSDLRVYVPTLVRGESGSNCQGEGRGICARRDADILDARRAQY